MSAKSQTDYQVTSIDTCFKCNVSSFKIVGVFVTADGVNRPMVMGDDGELYALGVYDRKKIKMLVEPAQK